MEYNDQKLKELLQTWEAPPAPQSLARRVFPRSRWWQWIWSGSIRVPVPVGFAALVIAGALWYWSRPPVSVPQKAVAPVSLADFRPVEQLEPKVISSGNYEGH